MTEEQQKPASEDAPQALQNEMPFAMVLGEPVTVPPQDLYIPPDALEVFLDAFEGPLDLLLYLIKRQNLDILTLPIANITLQYMEYIELMKDLRLELPRPVEEGEEDDPRAELIRRLQEYECFKKAAEDIDEIPRLERDVMEINVMQTEVVVEEKLPQVEMKDLLHALQQVLRRSEMYAAHEIKKETLSLRERMTQVLSSLAVDDFIEFSSLFTIAEGRDGVIVTFTAILELLKDRMIEIVQSEMFAPIYVKPAGQVVEGEFLDGGEKDGV